MKYIRIILLNLLLLFVLLTVIEYFLKFKNDDSSFHFGMSRYVKLREFGLPYESGQISNSPSMKNYTEDLPIKKFKVLLIH